ncbi:hypothetical protein [Diaphorobacter aerolatus]|uniref:Uncharacterized protein n=1 Tax=Diaphorobacter aerolatus TaxID=1288495 RepID=A0A7H0GJ89_9BURK|nr:hypothetical protein [Diaphorobacter aerolatus]QNP48355.1 hypothetical protein H9K75_20770 [Diaphorobacter aerolatus]
MIVRKQVIFGSPENHSSRELFKIASHFNVSNARACHFALYWLYKIEGIALVQEHNWVAKPSGAIFLRFTQEEDEKIQELMTKYSISFHELVKRVIEVVSKKIQDNKITHTDSKVVYFFNKENKK